MKRWSYNFLANKLMFVIALGAILASSVYAVYRTKTVMSAADAEATANRNIPPNEDLEVELINVLPNGFEPAEIIRPSGRFILLFDNQTRLQGLEFRVERAGVSVIPAVQGGRKTESTKILSLPAGEYHITEATHPEWKVTLTIVKR